MDIHPLIDTIHITVSHWRRWIPIALSTRDCVKELDYPDPDTHWRPSLLNIYKTFVDFTQAATPSQPWPIPACVKLNKLDVLRMFCGNPKCSPYQHVHLQFNNKNYTVKFWNHTKLQRLQRLRPGIPPSATQPLPSMLYLVALVAFSGLAFAGWLAAWVLAKDEGDEKMRQVCHGWRVGNVGRRWQEYGRIDSDWGAYSILQGFTMFHQQTYLKITNKWNG